MDKIDCVVIGAGVVGLAIAQKVLAQGNSCVVLDRLESFGQGVSSRNSEVIHGGLYYPAGSLKSKFCVRGNKLLYEFCKKRSIPHSRCGKFIVATSDDETDGLGAILKAATDSGVADLLSVTGCQINKVEPLIRAVEGIFSPSSGIIDSHSLMLSLVGEIEDSSGSVVGNTLLKRVIPDASGFMVVMEIDRDEYVLHSRCVINSAGLGAQNVAKQVEGFPESEIPQLHLCKGSYFSMHGKSPFNHLIYPVPPARGDGLGVHATIDLSGSVKFGPDVEYVDCEDYSVSDSKVDDFHSAISRYFPSVKIDRLSGAYSGIRPKLQGPSGGFKDFCINDGIRIGNDFEGLVQLFGIESPGLTSALAIAEHVSSLVDRVIP